MLVTKTIALCIIAARRGDDTDNWVNILFVAIMVVAWLVGSLVKAANKNQRQKTSPPLPRPPSRPGYAQGVRKPKTQTLGREPATARDVARPLPTPPRIGPQAVTQPLAIPELEVTQPSFTGLPATNIADSQSRGAMDMAGEAQSASPIPQSTAALSLENFGLEHLQMAVVYSEILATPVSLRDPRALTL
jgi:hypothetical protein